MVPRGLEALTQGDWEEAVTRATSFAQNLRVTLPRHLTVDDLVHTAVEQVLSGTRNFDLETDSLAGVLCNTIRSIVSPKGLAEYSRRMPLATEQEQANAIAPSSDDECLFSGSDRESIFLMAKQKANGNKPLVEYIEAFRANFSREESAELLGISVAECYELQREFKKLVALVVAELKPADKPL